MDSDYSKFDEHSNQQGVLIIKNTLPIKDAHLTDYKVKCRNDLNINSGDELIPFEMGNIGDDTTIYSNELDTHDIQSELLQQRHPILYSIITNSSHKQDSSNKAGPEDGLTSKELDPTASLSLVNKYLEKTLCTEPEFDAQHYMKKLKVARSNLAKARVEAFRLNKKIVKNAAINNVSEIDNIKIVNSYIKNKLSSEKADLLIHLLNKKQSFSNTIIKLSTDLYKSSPRAYRHCRKILNLPGESTIRTYVNNPKVVKRSQRRLVTLDRVGTT